jgi:hypothetical protein
MGTTSWLTIKNWDTFQHYKDRNPPWIKLHRALLDDYAFAALPDHQKAHLVLIWLFAASQAGGHIPDDAAFLSRKLGTTEAINLENLVNAGFLIQEQDASNVLAERKQDACIPLALARSRESESESESESKTEVPASDDAGCCLPAADNEKTDRQKSESCPYQQIIGAYHKHFPSGPQVSKLTDKRKRAIAARWREVRKGEYRTAGQPQAPRDQDKALHFFERYFAYCESLPWCTGRQPMKDSRHFRATIDNLIGADFMAKRSDEAHDAREAA